MFSACISKVACTMQPLHSPSSACSLRRSQDTPRSGHDHVGPGGKKETCAVINQLHGFEDPMPCGKLYPSYSKKMPSNCPQMPSCRPCRELRGVDLRKAGQKEGSPAKEGAAANPQSSTIVSLLT